MNIRAVRRPIAAIVAVVVLVLATIAGAFGSPAARAAEVAPTNVEVDFLNPDTLEPIHGTAQGVAAVPAPVHFRSA